MVKLEVTCDNGATAFLNGQKILKNPDWQKPSSRDITDLVKPGANRLTFEAKNQGGAAAFIARLSIKGKDGKTTNVESGIGWEAKRQGSDDWIPATVLAKYGEGPWGAALDEKPGGRGGASAPSTDVVETLPGFKAERLYTVPKGEQGSWVSMTVDPKGRLITGDQYGGLYRVTLPESQRTGAAPPNRRLKSRNSMQRSPAPTASATSSTPSIS